jgi:ABC-type phosphate transport system substrate-binding protein
MKIYYSIIVLMALVYSASNAQIAVIVNKSNSVSKIAPGSLKEMYMLSTSKWSDGKNITILDSREKSLQAKFYGFIGVSDVMNLKKQWMRVQLSGEGKAPTIVDDAQDMIDKVASIPGAIGYIRLSEVKGNEVKVIAKID